MMQFLICIIRRSTLIETDAVSDRCQIRIDCRTCVRRYPGASVSAFGPFGGCTLNKATRTALVNLLANLFRSHHGPLAQLTNSF